MEKYAVQKEFGVITSRESDFINYMITNMYYMCASQQLRQNTPPS
jgi:hypothetical protein